MYSAQSVAIYVINYSQETGIIMTNLKLQKILYFIQANFLLNDKGPCFEDEIEAWDFGPVVPSVYHEFKKFGGGRIPKIEKILLKKGNSFWDWEMVQFSKEIIEADEQALIEDVVNMLKDYSANQLVDLTHNQSPWLDVYRARKNNVITNDSIKSFFSEI